MAKKDFTQVNAENVYGTIAQATADAADAQEKKPARKARKTYTEEEAQEILQTLNTTGKKGIKLPRINLAFTQPNYEYINTMSRVTGLNLTEFVNEIIARHKEGHKNLYDQAMKFRDSL